MVSRFCKTPQVPVFAGDLEAWLLDCASEEESDSQNCDGVCYRVSYF